jgi:hypothetical protein
MLAEAVVACASHADHNEIVVTLTIDPGYHVNANPASIDYLIPTVVTVPNESDAKICYPSGHRPQGWMQRAGAGIETILGLGLQGELLHLDRRAGTGSPAGVFTRLNRL